MKKKDLIAVLLAVLWIFSVPAAAGTLKLKYDLKPGQKWTGTLTSQNQTGVISGKKKRNPSKTIVEYTVKKHPKKGWVTLEARILSAGKKRSRIDLSKITYSAEVHKSGEIRNITYSGDVMPDLGKNAANLPPQTLAMLKQSLATLPEYWKHMVYWFPELPEFGLEEGDEFDCNRKMSVGGPGPAAIQALVKQVFILEEVSDRLAYFSVKERSVTKGTVAGSDTKTKKAGKGDAVFDLETGMWLELTEKAKSKINMGAAAGAGSASNDMMLVRKFEMEPR